MRAPGDETYRKMGFCAILYAVAPRISYNQPMANHSSRFTPQRPQRPLPAPQAQNTAQNMPEAKPAAAPKWRHVCGVSAVTALFASRKSDIIRLYYTPEQKQKAGPICKYLAEQKCAYRQMSADELAKITATPHHGGLVAVVLASAISPAPVGEWQRQPPRLILALEQLGNPHNIGAIARTAAFFGVSDILLGVKELPTSLPDAAYRIAEGGLEAVRLSATADLPVLLRQLSNSFCIVGTTLPDVNNSKANKTEKNNADARFITNPADLPTRPIILVLGQEETGLTAATRKACEKWLYLPGSGQVQSLNVAATAAILCHALTSRVPVKSDAKNAPKNRQQQSK